jgi:hypothetical protein
MRRRDVIKRIGAAGAATVGVTGIASANRGNIKAIPWEFEDGHTEELSPEASTRTRRRRPSKSCGRKTVESAVPAARTASAVLPVIYVPLTVGSSSVNCNE